MVGVQHVPAVLGEVVFLRSEKTDSFTDEGMPWWRVMVAAQFVDQEDRELVDVLVVRVPADSDPCEGLEPFVMVDLVDFDAHVWTAPTRELFWYSASMIEAK